MQLRHWQELLVVSVCLAFVAACGGGGSDSPPPTYSVGGTVSGLGDGSPVVLQNAGTDNTTIATNGSFTFSQRQPNNASYAITVLTQPTGQTCTVTAGSGSIDGANVTSPSILCTVNTFTISGVVSGLRPAAQLTVQDNGGNSTELKVNGSFTFSMPVDYGASFSVTIVSQPPAENCIVSAGSQSGVKANVSSVTIVCSPASEVIVHNFAPKQDGIGPAGNVIQASDGNFYGATSSGGKYGLGTIFRVTPQGIETVLHAFSGGLLMGANPLQLSSREATAISTAQLAAVVPPARAPFSRSLLPALKLSSTTLAGSTEYVLQHHSFRGRTGISTVRRAMLQRPATAPCSRSRPKAWRLCCIPSMAARTMRQRQLLP